MLKEANKPAQITVDQWKGLQEKCRQKEPHAKWVIHPRYNLPTDAKSRQSSRMITERSATPLSTCTARRPSNSTHPSQPPATPSQFRRSSGNEPPGSQRQPSGSEQQPPVSHQRQASGSELPHSDPVPLVRMQDVSGNTPRSRPASFSGRS
ncbi:hypothetical protein K432DRAFT_111287 [Lepidopterella palustris CBS 459.81]|uniref:Uncharacterized protein n=1 Tax=Lepidopterella palustris CBS 459.81 TaxID=1314670 RepID=A0A8E2ELN2_9PEZI|nr:hypothetical protein K432DRAFT_111287 [Lepidopterella palustris CBS 459.81]